MSVTDRAPVAAGFDDRSSASNSRVGRKISTGPVDGLEERLCRSLLRVMETIGTKCLSAGFEFSRQALARLQQALDRRPVQHLKPCEDYGSDLLNLVLFRFDSCTDWKFLELLYQSMDTLLSRPHSV